MTPRSVAEVLGGHVTFEKGQRKDDITRDYLSRFEGDEGVIYDEPSPIR